MNDQPILFNSDMVRALLAGTKTQTRRPVTVGRGVLDPKPIGYWAEGGDTILWPDTGGDRTCPHGMPGDLLWVRETWCNMAYPVNDPVYSYRADTPDTDVDGWALPPGVTWRPSIHMPRAASRLALRITDVRVEQLLTISYLDANAEGFEDVNDFLNAWRTIYSVNAMRSNPYVWVISFDVLKQNIDDLQEAA